MSTSTSRSTTPTTTHQHQHSSIPHEKIAMRAYDKWCKRGRPHGSEKQDWLEAENELHQEMSRGGQPTTQRR